MRYIKFLMPFVLILMTSCMAYHEIEDNVMINACFVTENEGNLEYAFFISAPWESGKDVPDKSSIKEYKISANSFGAALEILRKSGKKYPDISHMRLFGGGADYFTEYFQKDEPSIRKNIKASSLVRTCVISENSDQIIESIYSEFDSSFIDFSDGIFSFQNSGLNSTLAELSLSVKNNFYTAAIPEVSIVQYGESLLPVVSRVCMFYSCNKLVALGADESEYYMRWRKKDGRYYNLYNINISGGKITVKLEEKQIAEIASRYAKINADILNTKYYSTKNFKTYNAYKDYFSRYDFSETRFVCGEI